MVYKHDILSKTRSGIKGRKGGKKMMVMIIFCVGRFEGTDRPAAGLMAIANAKNEACIIYKTRYYVCVLF